MNATLVRLLIAVLAIIVYIMFINYTDKWLKGVESEALDDKGEKERWEYKPEKTKVKQRRVVVLDKYRPFTDKEIKGMKRNGMSYQQIGKAINERRRNNG